MLTDLLEEWRSAWRMTGMTPALTFAMPRMCRQGTHGRAGCSKLPGCPPLPLSTRRAKRPAVRIRITTDAMGFDLVDVTKGRRRDATQCLAQ